MHMIKGIFDLVSESPQPKPPSLVDVGFVEVEIKRHEFFKFQVIQQGNIV